MRIDGIPTPFEKFNVSHVVTNRKLCKEMKEELKLPENTPAEELQFFK